jgi:hypothetical protein
MTMELTQYRTLPPPGFRGQEDFFFCLCPKNKALHWAASKWFSEPWQWQYCYVSMNHFEAATATEQQKGIAQKRNPSAQRGITSSWSN